VSYVLYIVCVGVAGFVYFRRRWGMFCTLYVLVLQVLYILCAGVVGFVYFRRRCRGLGTVYVQVSYICHTFGTCYVHFSAGVVSYVD